MRFKSNGFLETIKNKTSKPLIIEPQKAFKIEVKEPSKPQIIETNSNIKKGETAYNKIREQRLYSRRFETYKNFLKDILFRLTSIDKKEDKKETSSKSGFKFPKLPPLLGTISKLVKGIAKKGLLAFALMRGAKNAKEYETYKRKNNINSSPLGRLGSKVIGAGAGIISDITTFLNKISNGIIPKIDKEKAFKIASQIEQGLSTFINRSKEIYKQFSISFEAGAKSLWQGVKDLGAWSLNKVSSGIEGITSYLNKQTDGLIPVISASSILSNLTRLKDWTVEKFKNITNTLGEAWNSLSMATDGFIPKINKDKIINFFKGVADKTSEFVSSLVKDYPSITSSLSSFSDIAKKGVNNLIGATQKGITFLQDIFSKASKWVYDKVRTKSKSEKEFNKMSDKVEELKKLKKDLEDGLKNLNAGGVKRTYTLATIGDKKYIEARLKDIEAKLKRAKDREYQASITAMKDKNFIEHGDTKRAKKIIEQRANAPKIKANKEYERAKAKKEKLLKEIEKRKKIIEANKKAFGMAQYSKKYTDLLIKENSIKQKIKTTKDKFERDKLSKELKIVQDKIKTQETKEARTILQENITENTKVLKDLEAKLKPLQTIIKTKEIKKREVKAETPIKITNKSLLPTTKGSKSLEGYLRSLSKVESGATAKNQKYHIVNRFGYVGKYQMGKTTAKPFLKKIGKTWSDFKRDGRVQEKVIRMFTDQNATGLKKMGLKPTPFNLWVAHNQGLGGAKQILLKKGKQPKWLTRNISTNIGKGIAPTRENYIKYWKKKFRQDVVVDTKQHATSNNSGVEKKLDKLIEVTKENKPKDKTDIKFKKEYKRSDI